MISTLIDTIKIHAAIEHQSWISEQVQLLDAEVINPITKACSSGFRRFSVIGAFGSRATVQSMAGATELQIEASVPRFLTGQNVFGTEDLQTIAYLLVRAVCKHLGINPTAEEKRAVREGHMRLGRIDLTTHLKLDSDAQVAHFIKALKLQLMFSHRNVSSYGEDSLYLDQHSDTKTLKFYNKGRELQKAGHQLNPNLPQREYILAAAHGLLRTELVLRLRYLGRNGIREVCDWNPAAGRQLLRSILIDLKLSNVRLVEFQPQAALGKQANLLLAAHMAGTDVTSIMTSARALKPHARAILKATGIDIRIPFVAQTATLAVDLESFATVIEFGMNEKAVALGITNALIPKMKVHRQIEASVSVTPCAAKVGFIPHGFHRLKAKPIPKLGRPGSVDEAFVA